MFQTKIVEKFKTHISYSVTLLEYRVFCEIMWKNLVAPDIPQLTIWRRCISFLINKATTTHSEYVILTLHFNCNYTKAPQCYILRTLLVLLRNVIQWRVAVRTSPLVTHQIILFDRVPHSGSYHSISIFGLRPLLSCYD